MAHPAWETAEDALEYDAVTLFLQSARRVRPDFALQTSDLDLLARICRLTAGMPLALVLAASWAIMPIWSMIMRPTARVMKNVWRCGSP